MEFVAQKMALQPNVPNTGIMAHVFAAPPFGGTGAAGSGTPTDADGDIDFIDAAAFDLDDDDDFDDIVMPEVGCKDPEVWNTFTKRSTARQTKLQEMAKKHKTAAIRVNDVVGKIKASASGNRKALQGVAKEKA